jgi:cob(I)alamin adenosyltransferase
MKKNKKEILTELKTLQQQIIYLVEQFGKYSNQVKYKEKTIKVSRRFLDLYNEELLHSENSIPNCISQSMRANSGSQECYMTFKDFS